MLTCFVFGVCVCVIFEADETYDLFPLISSSETFHYLTFSLDFACLLQPCLKDLS